jgi:protein ImuA
MMNAVRADLVHSLKLRLQQKFGASVGEDSPSNDAVSTGIEALDELLPQRGIPKGGMVEWLTEDIGTGAATLALAGARSALKGAGSWVVIDSQRQFFPAAAISFGVPSHRLLLVHPKSEADAAWAFEQALRCPGVAMAWNWIESVNERMLQRWKIAAETGGGQGVLFRSQKAIKQAAWADVRWLVNPSSGTSLTGRQMCLKLLYCRGLVSEKQIELECDHETGVVRMASKLANSTSRLFAARA